MRDAMAALNIENPRLPFPPRDPSRPKGLNALGMLALHPELATAYHRFNAHILFNTRLTQRQREMLVLRVAHRRNATYEWTQHVVLAGDADLGDEDVARIVEGPDAPGWAPLDAALLRATDELLDDALISDTTWADLSAELGVEQLLDVIFTVGAYDVLAMAFRSFGVQLDEDLKNR
jgi:alkylhydroperoxidase family enzyme